MLLLSLLALAGCSDQKVSEVFPPPVVAIDAPEDGAVLDEGVPVGLVGTVLDERYASDLTQLAALWLVDGVQVCPDAVVDAGGVVTCTHVFGQGEDVEITLVASNPDGESDSATIHVTVRENGPPTATIVEPTADGVYYTDHLVSLVGLVGDGEDAPEDLVVGWTSSLDGDLGVATTPTSDGQVSGSVLLSEGEHFLTLQVTDTTGLTGQDQVTIEVGPPNTAPDCAITAPADGSTYAAGDPVTFEATASDPDVPADQLVATWSSDQDGTLATSSVTNKGAITYTTSTLSNATHTITLTVEDEVGGTCTDTIQVHVGSGPSVTLVAPASGAIYAEGEPVAFEAVVTDPDDPPTDLALTWESSLDGVFSTQPADAGGTAAFSTSALSPGSHTVTVTATDPLGFSGQDSATLVIDGVPTAPGVSIDPAAPVTTDDLRAVIDVPSVDPEGGTVTYTYAWYQNGVLTGVAANLVPSSDTTRGDEWEVLVTPSDGRGTGPAGTARVTIGNSPPEVGSVTIDPASPTVLDTLTCVASGVTDADGDAVTLSTTWTVDGASVGTGDTLAGAFSTGSTVSCTVTPDDGIDVGTPVTSAAVTIGNSPPTLADATLTPTTAYESSVLTCAPGAASDPDGDPVSFSFGWEVDGVLVAATGDTLDGAWFDRDQEVACIVTPSDGIDAGSPVTSNTVTILNSPPALDSVTITPDPADETSTLTCVPGTATDDDGDAVTFSYAWTVNGLAAGSGGTTLDGSAFDEGDQVVCTVTPSDGTDDGDPVSSDVLVIGNAPPSVTSVTLAPDPATAADTLTCTASGATDPDPLDTVSLVYRWTIDGGDPGVDTPTLSGLAARGEAVQCFVTPYDGSDFGAEVASNVVTLVNAPPELDSASLTPTTAYETSVLTCSPGTATDVDGDAVSFSYAWTVSGATVPATTDTLDGTWFDRDDAVSCTITPDDGLDTGAPVTSNTVTIRNSAPTIDAVTLSPDPAYEGSVLTCSATGLADADGDSVTVSITWEVSGVVLASTGTTLTGGSFDRGDAVLCRATPSDGIDTGVEVASNVVIIANTAPTLVSATVTPSAPTSQDTLTVTPSGWFDADGDPEGYLYQWYVNGAAVPGATSAALDPSAFAAGDTVWAEVTPYDGIDSGTAVVSNTVTVLNSAPSIGRVDLTPADPTETSVLACTAVDVSDPDGDPVTLTTSWTVNGSLIGATGDTLDGASFDRGDTVFCTVTPDDGIASGAPVNSNTVTILNSPPTLDAVTLAPDPAREGDTLSCTPGTASDVDGDAVSFTYAWEVSGVDVGATGSTLTGASFDRGDSVLCRVTPTDGTDDGAPVTSNTVTIENTPPSLASAAITPSSPRTDDTLTAVPSGWSDADGDAEGYLYQWAVDGVEVVGATASTLDGSAFAKGDVVTVTITPTDGIDAGTPVTSPGVTVVNSPPTAPGVAITPSDPQPEEDLLCTVVTASTDPDGDALTYTYAWSVGGVATGLTGSLLPASETSHGEVWTCEVVASDGTDASPPGSDSVTIADTVAPDPPVLTDLPDYANDEQLTLGGSCEPDCTLTFTLSDASGSWQETDTCSSSGAIAHTTWFARGDVTYVYATCTDAAGNVSGASNTVSTEICSVEDPYDTSAYPSGYGDSDAQPVDEWSALADDGATTIVIQGNQPDTTDADWYTIYADDDPLADESAGLDTFALDIRLTRGVGTFTFRVYRDGTSSADLQCPSLPGGYDTFEFYNADQGDGTHGIPADVRTCAASSSTANTCSDYSGWWTIEVLRDPAVSPSCQDFQVEVTNGVW